MIKFAQIVQIIDAVSCIVDSGLSFIGRRQPHRCDALIVQYLRIVPYGFPKGSVCRQIPFKILKHNTIFFTHSSETSFATVRLVVASMVKRFGAAYKDYFDQLWGIFDKRASIASCSPPAMYRYPMRMGM